MQDARLLLSSSQHFSDGLVVEASKASPLHRDDKNEALANLLASIVDAGKPRSPESCTSVGAWRVFPITTISGPVGILAVIPKAGAASLPKAACALLSRLSRQTALLIENYNLYNNLIRKAAEVTGIATVAGATLDGQDLPALLALVADQAAVLAGVEDVAILLEEAPSACWKIAAGRGTLAAALRDHQAPLDAGIPARIYREGKTVIANHIEALADVLPCGSNAPVCAALMVPLRKGERIIGILACLQQAGGRRFTEHDARALEVLADQAVIAINNARLYQNAITRKQFQQGVLTMISELRSATDPDTLLRACCPHVANLLCTPAVCVCRPSGDAPQILAQYPQPAADAPQCRCNIKDCPAAQAQPGGQDFPQEMHGSAEGCPVLRHHGTHAFYCTPLLPQKEAGAVLLFAGTESGTWFDGEWLRLAQLLCSHLNSCLETAIAFSAQQQEVEISNTLLAVAHLVTTEPNIEQVLRTVQDAAVNVLGQGTRIFFLRDNSLVPTLPVDGDETGWQRFTEGDARLAEALRNRREPLLIADLTASDLISPALAAHFARGPLLICPLVTRQEELLGAMIVGHQEEGR
ncbi:MAG TPA: GAF domain-containing protein, partial [Armatimonadota bacterium]|nr:GAF domain-containing protein [Armatimonadota bacterium]